MLGMIPRLGKLPTQIATPSNAAIGDAESDAQETKGNRIGMNREACARPTFYHPRPAPAARGSDFWRIIN
jgi:hypothetical protein